MDQTLNNKNDIDRFVAATAIERIWWYQQAEDRWYSWIKGQDQNTLTQLSPDAIYWVYSTREQIIARASGINSERFFLHNNHLGSVAFETNVDGDITESSNYQPYGSAKANSQQSYEKVGTYSFSGKEQDGSGLYYFEARYYDPVTTRFITPDPLFAGEMAKCIESIIECNLYQYTGNNPVVYMDDSGLEIRYANHEVAFGKYHSKLVIYPENQQKWSSSDFMKTGGDGRKFFTIGGGPDSSWWLAGPLEIGINRELDVDKHLQGKDGDSIILTLPERYISEDSAIESLIGSVKNYESKDNKPEYALSPGGSDRNSNGIISGILNANGFDIPGKASMGWNSPKLKIDQNEAGIRIYNTPGLNLPVSNDLFEGSK
jgi:RHS repeat-associated protein